MRITKKSVWGPIMQISLFDELINKAVTGGTRGIGRAIVTVALKFSVSQARALAAYWPS